MDAESLPLIGLSREVLSSTVLNNLMLPVHISDGKSEVLRKISFTIKTIPFRPQDVLIKFPMIWWTSKTTKLARSILKFLSFLRIAQQGVELWLSALDFVDKCEIWWLNTIQISLNLSSILYMNLFFFSRIFSKLSLVKNMQKKITLRIFYWMKMIKSSKIDS